jgi:hypothetical protein
MGAQQLKKFSRNGGGFLAFKIDGGSGRGASIPQRAILAALVR